MPGCRHNDGEDPVAVADEMREKDILIIIAAIGGADLWKMNAITGDPSELLYSKTVVATFFNLTPI